MFDFLCELISNNHWCKQFYSMEEYSEMEREADNENNNSVIVDNLHKNIMAIYSSKFLELNKDRKCESTRDHTCRTQDNFARVDIKKARVSDPENDNSESDLSDSKLMKHTNSETNLNDKDDRARQVSVACKNGNDIDAENKPTSPVRTTAFSVADILDPRKFTGSTGSGNPLMRLPLRPWAHGQTNYGGSEDERTEETGG